MAKVLDYFDFLHSKEGDRMLVVWGWRVLLLSLIAVVIGAMPDKVDAKNPRRA